jgi:hypothetical protein
MGAVAQQAVGKWIPALPKKLDTCKLRDEGVAGGPHHFCSCVCRRQQMADADAETRAMATNINLDGESGQTHNHHVLSKS